MSNIDNISNPTHVAIIMDGNGRWAKKKGLPRIAGHKEGVNKVKEIIVTRNNETSSQQYKKIGNLIKYIRESIIILK